MGKAELDSSVDYYRILEISFPSSQVDIRRAFLELARTQHPDKNPGRETEFKAKFQAITTAYDVLKDPTLKRTYDQIRPAARKFAAQPKPTASSKPSPATAKAASEAAARASAFPRQAKTNFKATPKSPPKKSQTKHKDPFFDWTPPVPTNKPAASRPSPRPDPSYYKDHLNGSAGGGQAYGTPRRAPTAARTSAFSATRDSASKTQEFTAGSKPTIPLRSKPDLKKKKTQPTNAQVNEPSERGWWARSATAYSTFNAATSKYSPYAADASSPSRTFPSNAQEENSSTTPKSFGTDTQYAPSNAPHARNIQDPLQPAQYSWQNSRGAYQQRNKDSPNGDVRPVKQPRGRRPVRTSGSPKTFRTPESCQKSRSDSETTPSGASTEPLRYSAYPDLHGTDKLESELSQSSDSDPQSSASGTGSESGSDSDASWTFAARKKKAEKTTTDEKTLPSRRVFHKFRPAFSTPVGPTDAASAKNSTTPQSDRYSFQFRPSPAQSVPGSNSSRKASGTVPYVHLNKVPDINFTSPTARSESFGPLPFSATKEPAKTEDNSPCKAEKKSDSDAGIAQSTTEKSDAANSLADQFSRVELDVKSSPLKFSFTADLPDTAKRAEEASSRAPREEAAAASASHPQDKCQPNTQRNPFSFEYSTISNKSGEADVPAFTFPRPAHVTTFSFKEAEQQKSSIEAPKFSFAFTEPNSLDRAQSNTQHKPFSFPTSTTEKETEKAGYMPSFAFATPNWSPATAPFPKQGQDVKPSTVLPTFTFGSVDTRSDAQDKASGSFSSFSQHSAFKKAPSFRFFDPRTDVPASTEAPSKPSKFGMESSPPLGHGSLKFGNDSGPPLAPKRFIFGTDPEPPVVPWHHIWDRSSKVSEAIDPITYRHDYLAKMWIFENYFEAWKRYRATARWDDEGYRTALLTYQKVREAHDNFEREHLAYISELEK